jgi:hypothetical protein
MVLDPALAKILDPIVATMRQTFAKHLSDEEAVVQLLWLLVAQKLVKLCEDTDGHPVWVATDRLRATADLPSNVIPLHGEAVVDTLGATKAPRVLPSLQIVLDAAARRSAGLVQQGQAGGSSCGLELLVFAGKDLAALVNDAEGELVWVPTPRLLKAVTDDPANGLVSPALVTAPNGAWMTTCAAFSTQSESSRRRKLGCIFLTKWRLQQLQWPRCRSWSCVAMPSPIAMATAAWRGRRQPPAGAKAPTTAIGRRGGRAANRAQTGATAVAGSVGVMAALSRQAIGDAAASPPR